jgi:hypothetical protein
MLAFGIKHSNLTRLTVCYVDTLKWVYLDIDHLAEHLWPPSINRPYAEHFDQTPLRIPRPSPGDCISNMDYT